MATRLIIFSILHQSVFCQKRINTTGFPDDFGWGTATAAYQIEGAADEDGRGPSIWDVFSHQPGNTFDGATGDVADDFYHLYPEDIKMMSDLGIDTFRLSLSWSRIIPEGRGEVNRLGVEFYRNVITELLANGITPSVTLYHWDLPQALQDDYGGWLNRERIVEDFAAYAQVCFEEFGDLIQSWITFNEPMSFVSGYRGTGQAPGIISDQAAFEIPASVVIAHATAVDLYRRNFGSQGGQIAITLDVQWCEPLTESTEDFAACQRYILSALGIYADPVFFGDYGEDMKAFLGNDLNVFSEEEKELLKGSHDFFGLNFYTARFGANDPNCNSGTCVILTKEDDEGLPIGAQSASDYLVVAPFGFRNMLSYVKDRYDDPPIHVTENGYSDPDLPLVQNNEIIPPLLDTGRELQIITYMDEMRLAIVEDKVDVRSYYHWSLLDNFEWSEGFSKRFGLIYVDYADDLKRIPKASFTLYKNYIASARKHALPRKDIFGDKTAGLLQGTTGGYLVLLVVFSAVAVGCVAIMYIHYRKAAAAKKESREQNEISMVERLMTTQPHPQTVV